MSKKGENEWKWAVGVKKHIGNMKWGIKMVDSGGEHVQTCNKTWNEC